MDSKLLVRVYRAQRAGRGDSVHIGTAYPIAPGKLLTARHVLADEGDGIDPTRLTLTWYRQKGADGKRFKSEDHAIKWAWDGKTLGWDAAILECPFPGDVSVDGRVLSDRCPKLNDVWSSEGFPETGQLDEVREPQPLKGTVFPCAEDAKLFHLEADGPPPTAEGWRGTSGAPVFVGGRILGMIAETRKAYSGNRILAIPLFRLLQIPEFRMAAGLPALGTFTRIDFEPFVSEIEKHLLSAPDTIARIGEILKKPSIQKSSIAFPVAIVDLPARAHNLANQLVEAAFGDAMRLLRRAHLSCTTPAEEKERRVFFDVLCWFLPASYDRRKSEVLRLAYQTGNVKLIEAQVATALAAELVIAAAELRPAIFDRDARGERGPVGKHKIPAPPRLGLGATEQEELIAAVDGYLFHKYSFGADFSGEPKSYRLAIRAHLRESADCDPGVPYLLFGGPLDKSGLGSAQLAALADAVKALYPELSILRLSNERDIEQGEFAQLASLRALLQGA